jgi:hypothetical protein
MKIEIGDNLKTVLLAIIIGLCYMGFLHLLSK